MDAALEGTNERTLRPVPALVRAAAVLDYLSDLKKGAGTSDIARALGLPKSSVHGLCETLVQLDLLRSEAHRYRLGPHALRWSAAFLESSDLVREFERALAQDGRLAAYTATLSTLQGAEVVYLARRNGDKPLGFTFEIGKRLPAPFTATGKAMLSQLAKDERARILSGDWPRPLTHNSVTSAASFEDEVARWRAEGFAIDRGEIRAGMICLGASVLDEDGRPAAGVAISLTNEEATPDALAEGAELVRELARRLSRAGQR